MGYLLLAASLLAGATKGYCGKKMGNFAENTAAASLLNLVRMAICVPLSVLMLLCAGEVHALVPTFPVLAISAASGIFTAFFVVSWLVSVRRGAYMMVDAFLMLGTMVPMVCGKVFLDEPIGFKRLLGYLILFCAVLILCSYNNGIKCKLTLPSFLVLVFCGFANGVVDLSQKLFVKLVPTSPVSVFNFYTYLFASITLLITFWVLRRKDGPRFAEEGARFRYLYVAIMAVALILHSFFKTLAAVHLDSAVLYPLSQSLALIVTTLMAALFFGERLNAKAAFGVVLCLIGMLVMNVL